MKLMNINMHKEDNELFIELDGIWDMSASEEFVMTCASLGETETNVTVDLDKVEYVYVSGLRQLLYIQYLAAKKHYRLKIINVDQRTYKKLLDLNYIERMDITTKIEEQS